MLLVLLLELHRADTTDGLFALDALLFASLENLLVFYTELASLDIKAVERDNDGIRVRCLTKVGEGEAAERARLIKMVVERIRSWDRERGLSGEE